MLEPQSEKEFYYYLQYHYERSKRIKEAKLANDEHESASDYAYIHNVLETVICYYERLKKNEKI